MDTVTVDEYQRVQLKTAKPGQVFSFEQKPDGTIVLREAARNEIRLLKPIRVKGKLHPPADFRPSRELIAAAIRADDR